MSDTVKWFFILIGFAAIVVFVRVQSFDSNAEAWAAFKRWMAEAPERLRDSYAAATRERDVGIEVALVPRAVLARAVEAMTRSGRHALEARSENSLTFVRREKPSSLVAILLLLFFHFARNPLFVVRVEDGEGNARRICGRSRRIAHRGGDDRWTEARLTE